MTAILIVSISLAAAFCFGKKSFLAASSYSLVASLCYLFPLPGLGEHYFLAQSIIDFFIIVLMYLFYTHIHSPLCKHIIYFSLASILVNFVGWSVYNHTGSVTAYNYIYLVVYAGILVSILMSRADGDRRYKHRRIYNYNTPSINHNNEAESWTKSYKR